MKSVLVAFAAVLLLAVPAMSGIVNGDFSSGELAPWVTDFAADSPAFNSVVITDYASSSDVVELMAANTYTWTGGQWQCDQPDTSSAAVGQVGITLDSGTTGVQFRAAAFFAGPGEGDYGGTSAALPSMIISMTYYKLGSTHLSQAHPVGIDDADWDAIRQIDLPNVDTSKPADIWITVTSPISSDDVPGPSDSESITVTGYADDFVLVPEPACMSMLVLGALALIRRRKT